MSTIDLPAEQVGIACECCRDEAAAYNDAEMGHVCADCFAHGLQAVKQLHRVGLHKPPKCGPEEGPCQR